MIQNFLKNDNEEQKIINSVNGLDNAIGADLSNFYNDAYKTSNLGDVLKNTGASVTSKAIASAVWRVIFYEIFETFLVAGTLRAYEKLFKTIFGDDVILVFTQSKGELHIDITASSVGFFDATLTDGEGGLFDFGLSGYDPDDTLGFLDLLGLKNDDEINTMLFELVPSGIYVTVSLTLA